MHDESVWDMLPLLGSTVSRQHLAKKNDFGIIYSGFSTLLFCKYFIGTPRLYLYIYIAIPPLPSILKHCSEYFPGIILSHLPSPNTPRSSFQTLHICSSLMCFANIYTTYHQLQALQTQPNIISNFCSILLAFGI